MDLSIISEELRSRSRNLIAEANKFEQVAVMLDALNGVEPESSNPAPEAKPKKKFSLAVRRRMAAAQKLRYAKERQLSLVVKKRKLSPAGLRAIRKAQKARWARFKKQASV